MEQLQPLEPLHQLQPTPQVTTNQTQSTDDSDDAFSYDGYEVIRGEYFSQSIEPQFTFSNFQVSVNAACLKKLPETTYVQLLINPATRKLIVRPCYEDEKDSFPWANAKRKPRKIACPIFFIKVVQLMNWNPSYRYKLLGKMLTSKTERLFIFDLKNPQIYKKIPNRLNNPTAERTPLFPAAWQQHFGQPYFEHKADIQVNIFKDMAIIGTWEGDQLSFGASMLHGIAKLIACYGDDLNDEIFKEKLGRISTKEIVRTAKDRKAGPLGFAEAMLLIYNKKMQRPLPFERLYSKKGSSSQFYDEGNGENLDYDLDSPFDTDYDTDYTQENDELSLPIFGQEATLPVAQ